MIHFERRGCRHCHSDWLGNFRVLDGVWWKWNSSILIVVIHWINQSILGEVHGKFPLFQCISGILDLVFRLCHVLDLAMGTCRTVSSLASASTNKTEMSWRGFAFEWGKVWRESPRKARYTIVKIQYSYPTLKQKKDILILERLL